MKRILGLDLGTNSIGWAVVNEAETNEEKSSIVKLGVRVNPLTVDEKSNFEKGKSITTNADRTLKRSMRRNLQRYKLRRDALVGLLRENGWITEDTVFAEQGNFTTFQTLGLRAKAASEKISLEELARVLLSINKKRGYKSSRKVQGDEEGQLIDGMDIAKVLYEDGKTPGEYVYERLSSDINYKAPDFYRSDLQNEFDRIWGAQKAFYPDILTDGLKEELRNKNEKQTWAICQKPLQIEGIKRTAKGKELVKENYEWRVRALSEKLELESLAVVLQKINSQIRNSSGYLGDISDRSKELYFNGQTVGQYQVAQLEKNPNHSLKNQVFYRQDYMDEFEKIWECQARYHTELTPSLKHQLRDIVIFYQRPLKSQKGLVSICELEGRQVEVEADGKKKKRIIGPKVCPKSSPLFQEFKIWQVLNNVTVNRRYLTQDEKEELYDRLCTCDKLPKSEVIKYLKPDEYNTEWAQDSLFAPDEMYEPEILSRKHRNKKEINLNYKELEGNRTMAALLEAYSKIILATGHEEYDFSKKKFSEAVDIISDVFRGLGYRTDFLHFDSSLEGKAFEEQASFRLWHLLYSYEGDNSVSGNDMLISKISEITGFEPEYAKILASVSFAPDYGSLSSRAMKKILPYMKEGNTYSLACEYAGYRHSKRSLTKEELENKEYKDKLESLPKNSLRNPVVEKILNQMINVVNGVIDEYGKPDEIRIELARELKKSAKEREEMTAAISKSSREHEDIRKKLIDEFGMENPSRNDIVRYKLYEELSANGYKTLYTDTYIPREKLFSKEFDIEHIIPQSRRFDDSFANKTIEARHANIEKGNATAFDYVKGKDGEKGAEAYRSRIENLKEDGCISWTKCKNLLMTESEIPDGFIDRDLRDSQYIAKKAREILESIVRDVVPTTGSITDRLREDWQLVDVMKELNWKKYDSLGQTYTYYDKDGRTVRKIKDWTKRNDHRHHAMDALTIAFTKRSYIQYLNNLNARISKSVDDAPSIDLSDYELRDIPKSEMTKVVRAIEHSCLYRDNKNKLRFCPPIPLDEFRAEAKRQLENTLVSIKAKNKVVTRNTNKTKKQGGVNSKVQLTPRGQLHNETVYGSIRQYVTKEEKVGSGFTREKIATVANAVYREALLSRLAAFGNDPKKAFTGKNSLDNNPIYLDGLHTQQVPAKVKTVSLESIYTIRKPVDPDLNVDKVIDAKVKELLQRRLDEHRGDPKKAFVNLDENPIWLNKEKGISIKRVAIRGVNNAEPLHEKRDNDGNAIVDSEGQRIPSDFVNTGNNHHVAIYMDADGNLQEKVVSFYEAVARINIGMPVVDKEYKKDEGWEFLFTMKQNEYFVFPNTETFFDPKVIDLMDPENYSLISPNLFRVQKLTTKCYVFRHHLETTVDDINALRNTTWKRIQNCNGLKGVVKVRINHIGQIVQVGEY